MKTALILIAACVVCISASAQVHRCTDASGKVSFSDTPCATSQKGGLVQRAPSAAEIDAERWQAAQARQNFQAQQSREAWREANAAQQQGPYQLAPAPTSPGRECAAARKNGWGNQSGAMQQAARAACARALEQEREALRELKRRGNCDYNSEIAADGTRCGMRSADARPGGRMPP